MTLDPALDRAMQIFVANREERQRTEKALKALLRKEEEAARVLSNLVKERLPL